MKHKILSHNYESIDVFCSWTHDSERVFAKEAVFNALWNDYEPHIKTIDFPKLQKINFKDIDITLLLMRILIRNLLFNKYSKIM